MTVLIFKVGKKSVLIFLYKFSMLPTFIRILGGNKKRRDKVFLLFAVKILMKELQKTNVNTGVVMSTVKDSQFPWDLWMQSTI